MDGVTILPQEQVIRRMRAADDREFALFLGAGASRSSGIVLASEMIAEWRRIAFEESAPAGADFEAWCAGQPWFGSPTEYSELFELLFPDERARQGYIEEKIKKRHPSWGYLYLAHLMHAKRINLVFTTNFDDLLNQALTQFYGYNAVVCAADSEVGSINVSTARAKVIKLHGDYLFKRLKNTGDELAQLDANMGRKFGEFARQCGLVVLGYAGGDLSIMSQLEVLLEDQDSFPAGLYWGVHDPDAPRPAPLHRLLAAHPKRLRLFRCEDFDGFMARLHERMELPEPLMIAEPLRQARSSFDRLLEQTTPRQREQALIRQHADHLEAQLGGSIARVEDAGSLDLFDAQIALGSRQHAVALQRIEPFVAAHPNHAQALTVWGLALRIQAEEEGRPLLLEQAAAKWREAVRAEPAWTEARYHLVRHHALRQEYAQAIAEAEPLVALVPRDMNLRQNLAQLYASAGRIREALATIDQLLTESPDDATLHVLRAQLLEQRSRPVEALAALQRALQIAPANPWIRLQAANAYMRTARPLEAASEFQQAIQLEPRNAGLRLQAAMFFLQTNQAPQALPHLREAVRLEADAPEVRGWLATAYMAMNALADAQREIDAALQLDPHDARLLATAGQVHAASMRPDLAEACLQRAIAASPNNIGPYTVLAQVYARWQRWPQLNGVMARLHELDPAVARQLHQQFSSMPPGGAPGFGPPGFGSPGFGPPGGQPQGPQGGPSTPLAGAAQRLFDWLGGQDPNRR